MAGAKLARALRQPAARALLAMVAFLLFTLPIAASQPPAGLRTFLLINVLWAAVIAASAGLAVCLGSRRGGGDVG